MPRFYWDNYPEALPFVDERLDGRFGSAPWKRIAVEFNDEFGTNYSGNTMYQAYHRRKQKAEAEKRHAVDFGSLIRVNKQLKHKVEELEDAHLIFREVIKGALAPLPPYRAASTAKKRGAKDAELLGLLLSDIQPSLVTLADTAGLGQMNKDTLPGMVDMWAEKVLLITEILRSDHPVNELVIFGLGDYVEGEDIYPGQAWHLDMNLHEQIVTLADLFSTAIRRLGQEGKFKTITLYMVPGNHGRLGKPGKIRANADDFFISFLELALSKIASITVHHSASPLMCVRLFEKWNCLLSHGHETKAWMGIPWYGLERDTLKHSAMMQMPIHYKFIGHHHKPALAPIGPNCNWMANGCWTGPTDFSVNRLKSAIAPEQWAFGFHPKIGRTCLWDIRLGEVPVLKPDENGILTPVFDKLGGSRTP